MTDVDPYVTAPSEPGLTPRLAGLRVWLILAVILLLGAAWIVADLLGAREDPTLQFPGGTATPPPAATAPAVEVPVPPLQAPAPAAPPTP